MACVEFKANFSFCLEVPEVLYVAFHLMLLYMIAGQVFRDFLSSLFGKIGY